MPLLSTRIQSVPGTARLAVIRGPGERGLLQPYRRSHGVLTTSAKRGAPSSHATRAPLAVKLMA